MMDRAARVIQSAEEGSAQEGQGRQEDKYNRIIKTKEKEEERR